MNRRDFLRALGIGAAAVAIEPVRRMWFVPSTAPVGSRVEHFAPPGTLWNLATGESVRFGTTEITFNTHDGPWFYEDDAIRAHNDAQILAHMEALRRHFEHRLATDNAGFASATDQKMHAARASSKSFMSLVRLTSILG